MKCSKTITINADRKTVWAILTNINNWGTWQTDISKPRLNGDLKPETTFDWHTGGTKIHSTLHTVKPHSQFGWTGKAFGMFAIHNWTLTETDGKTLVVVDESMEGFLAGLFKKPLNKNLEKGMQKWLALLKQECEMQDQSAKEACAAVLGDVEGFQSDVRCQFPKLVPDEPRGG